MVNEELDLPDWQVVATSIAVAMATGVIVRAEPAWRAFERVRRAVAFADLERARAQILLVRRRHPEAYARFVARLADCLPPAMVAGSRDSGGVGLPPRGDETTPALRDDGNGCARATQPDRHTSQKGES